MPRPRELERPDDLLLEERDGLDAEDRLLLELEREADDRLLRELLGREADERLEGLLGLEADERLEELLGLEALDPLLEGRVGRAADDLSLPDERGLDAEPLLREGLGRVAAGLLREELDGLEAEPLRLCCCGCTRGLLELDGVERRTCSRRVGCAERPGVVARVR